MGDNTFICPKCKVEGKKVKKITVQHLIRKEKAKEISQDFYYLCINENCDVVYYSQDDNTMYYKDDIKVPVWFKNDANPKYVCYCNEVTEEQVINAVLNKGARNMKDIIKLTGAMRNGQCEIRNPSGECCHEVVQKAIEKGLQMITS